LHLSLHKALSQLADSPHFCATPSPNNRSCDMENVTEAALTESFDQLVSEGVIVYGPHESVKLDDQGYPVS
jgi:hypothetical protein